MRRELSYKLPAPVDAVAIVDTSTLLVFRMQGDTATAIQTLRMSRETLVLLDTVTTPGICVGRRYFRVTAQGYSGVGNIGPTEDALLHIARRGVRVESLAGLRRLDEFYGGSLSCGDTIYVWATRPTNQAERRGVTVKGAAYTLQGLGPARVVGEFARMNTLWDITDSWMLLGTLGTRKFTIVRKLPPPAGHGNSALTHEGRQ